MSKKPSINDTDIKFYAQVNKRKAEGWDIHLDSNGWYVVAPNEKEPKNGESLGTGRTHYREKKEAWQDIIRHDTEPKPRDTLRMVAVLVSICAVLAAPFIISNRNDKKSGDDSPWKD
jgi:hypothetical protein